MCVTPSSFAGHSIEISITRPFVRNPAKAPESKAIPLLDMSTHHPEPQDSTRRRQVCFQFRGKVRA